MKKEDMRLVKHLAAQSLDDINRGLANRGIDADAVITLTRSEQQVTETTTAGASVRQAIWFDVYYRALPGEVAK